MKKQEKVASLTVAGILLGPGGIIIGLSFPKVWFIGFIIFLAGLALIVWAVSLKHRAGSPQFFIHYGKDNGGWVSINRAVIDQLTEKDVDPLSSAEQEFWKYCHANPKFKSTLTIQDGKTMTQERICQVMLGATQGALFGDKIDLAEVLVTKLGPDSLE